MGKGPPVKWMQDRGQLTSGTDEYQVRACRPGRQEWELKLGGGYTALWLVPIVYAAIQHSFTYMLSRMSQEEDLKS